jgi:putative acetyltransferase
MPDIREERPADVPFVRDVNYRAFPGATEADLVDAIRSRAEPVVSLVAIEDDEVVGHIMFSPVELIGNSSLKIMGLAPMAVSPERQNHGIGSTLVREGLNRCRKLGAGAVVVLGHPAYYPRFGFRPASELGIACEYDVPDEAFMIMELKSHYLPAKGGTIRYHEVFAEAQ